MSKNERTNESLNYGVMVLFYFCVYIRLGLSCFPGYMHFLANVYKNDTYYIVSGYSLHFETCQIAQRKHLSHSFVSSTMKKNLKLSVRRHINVSVRNCRLTATKIKLTFHKRKFKKQQQPDNATR